MKENYLKYIASLLLFGSNGIVASYIALSSYEIVLSRSLIGGLFLIGILIISKQQFQFYKHKKDFAYLIISGAAMGTCWMFLYEAYVQIGVGLATLIFSCGPVILIALSPIVFKEKITIAKLIGLFCVCAGMLFVNYQGIAHGGLSWGLVCGLLSALTFAIMVIFNKKVTNVTGLENAIFQLSMGFIVVCIFTLIKQGISINIPVQSIFPILCLGVVNTGVGCYLYFSSITKLPVQSVAICGYLEPVSALVFSALFLSEKLTLIELIGTVFILGGAAFAELFKRQRL